MLPPDQKKMTPNNNNNNNNNSEAPAQQVLVAPEAAPAAASAPPPAVSAAPGLGTMLHALRRCWWYALPLGLVAGLLGAAGSLFVFPGSYNSTVVFRLLPRPTHGSQEDEGHFLNVQRSHVSLMKSHEVLDETIRKSQVAEKYGVVYTPRSLAKNLTATFNEGAEIMTVTLAGEHPEAMEAVLAALGEVYPRRATQADRERLETRIAQLRRRLDSGDNRRNPGRVLTLAEQLHDKRIELAKAEKDANLDSAPMLRAKLLLVQETQRNLRGEISRRKAELGDLQAKLQAENNNDPVRVSVRPVRESDVKSALGSNVDYAEALKAIKDLRADVAAAEEIFSGAALVKATASKKRNLERWKDYREEVVAEVRRDLAEKNKALAEEEQRKLEADRRLEGIRGKSREKELERQIRALDEDLVQWTKKEEAAQAGGPAVPPEVAALRDQEKQLSREFDEIGGEVARLQGLLASESRVRLHAAPFVPEERDTSKSYKVALGMGVLVMLCCLGALCFWETTGRRVYSSGDVLQGLGMRVVGTLPRLPASARGKKPAAAAQQQSLADLSARSGMNDAVDAIRTVLMHSPRTDGARVILISSAIGGEGKTTLASQLAASLARAWRKTLLIDGDLRKPALHAQFDLPMEPGFSEALRGDVEFDDVIKPTMTSRLWLMPAGKVDGHSLQALAQEALANVFAQLKGRYDFIVVDTSPVLLVPDGLMLAEHADAVLLAVRRDHSRIPAVYAAQQKLLSLGVTVLGGVIIGEKTETYGHAVPYPRS